MNSLVKSSYVGNQGSGINKNTSLYDAMIELYLTCAGHNRGTSESRDIRDGMASIENDIYVIDSLER